MAFERKINWHYKAAAISFASAVIIWLSLDRRFLEKYYFKWSINDWELSEFPLLIATSVFAYVFAKSLFHGLSKIDTQRNLKFDRLSWSLLVGNLIIVCMAAALILFGREYLALNVKELGHVAVAQEFFILASLVLLIAAAMKMRKINQRSVFGIKSVWICGLMGIAVFLLLMEEISWGQHFVGWGTPDAFKQNIQNETNIHNFYTNRFEFLYYSLAFVCFVLLPIAIGQIKIPLFEPVRLFVPPVSFGLAAIPVAGFMYENWGILAFQIYFLVAVCLAFVAANAAHGKSRYAVIAVGLAMMLSQIVYLVYGHKLIFSYEISEMRELAISLTLAAYSVWLLAKARVVSQEADAG